MQICSGMRKFEIYYKNECIKIIKCESIAHDEVNKLHCFYNEKDGFKVLIASVPFDHAIF